MNQRRWQRSQTVSLPPKGCIHATEEATHLLNRANWNDFHSVGVAQNPQLLANPQLQGGADGMWNHDLKLGGNSDGIHTDKGPYDEHSTMQVESTRLPSNPDARPQSGRRHAGAAGDAFGWIRRLDTGRE
jgi:hypothetical protein